MSCPNANLEPRTATSTGPSMGATLTTFILVPGVNPMSSSRCRTLCSPRMKLILPYLPPLSSRIEMRFLFRLPTSSKPWLWSFMQSSQFEKGKSHAGMVLPSSEHVSGCFRRRHRDSSASSERACSIWQASL